jgi:hypothetical protein
MASIEQAIEEIIDNYMRDYDLSSVTDDAIKAVTDDIQSDLDKIDELEARIADLEGKLNRMCQALRSE